MKNIKIYCIIFALLLVCGATFNLQFNNKNVSDPLLLMNIEALAEGEGGTTHYWCCGCTVDCVEGTNGIVIKGQFSSSPCQ